MQILPAHMNRNMPVANDDPRCEQWETPDIVEQCDILWVNLPV